MNNFTIKDLQNFEIDISISSLLLSLIVATICSLVIKYVYKKFSQSINNKENFSNIFVLLAITTTIVITVVKFSLALSLGLVGALSVVRFRAAIKEPEELVYLFFNYCCRTCIWCRPVDSGNNINNFCYFIYLHPIVIKKKEEHIY